MSETTCETCAHWLPPSERTDYRQIFRGDADKQYGVCRLIELGDSYEEAPTPLPLAVTKDGSDYDAVLFTRAAFGCVLWGARTAATTPTTSAHQPRP